MKWEHLSIVIALTSACSSAPSTQVQPNASANMAGESCETEEGAACAHHVEGHECNHGHEGAACAHHGEGHACDHGHGGAGNATPPRAGADGSQLFGAELNGALSTTPLATILASPQTYVGQTVRTEGEVSAVCQRMGCWMELRTDGGAVRVPIAGHAFFLPRDITGRHAIIEGTVSASELTAEQRAHLASEGAQALGAGVSIAATGVQLLP